MDEAIQELDLPEGWTWCSLHEIVGADGMFKDGDWIETKDQDPNGEVRLIQLADIGEGIFKNRSSRYLTMEKARELGCTFLKSGDLLIARLPGPLGRACIFTGDRKPAITAVDVSVVRTGTDGPHILWLMHALNSPNARTQIEKFQRGTTRGRISRKNLGKVRIPKPPLTDQMRIVTKIEEVLRKVNAVRERLISVKEIMKRFRQSVLSAACSGQLTESWRDEQRCNSDWRDVCMAEIGEVTGGITKNSARTTLPLQVPYLRVANVYENELRCDDVGLIGVTQSEFGRAALRNGDLLFVEGNGSIEQVGRVALWDGSIKQCVHQNHLIKFRASRNVVPSFALYWMMSHFGRTSLVEAAVSTAGLYNLSISKVENIPISLPSLEEQEEIVRRVESLFNIADTIEMRVGAELLKGEKMTQAILAKAFRGELAPTELCGTGRTSTTD